MVDLLTPGGNNLVDSWLAADQTPMEQSGHAVIVDASAAQVAEAVAALAEGDIEYVILEEGSTFLQAAGDGDGPYHLEFNPGSLDEQVAATGPVDRAALDAAMSAFATGDPSWQTSHTWGDAGLGGGGRDRGPVSEGGGFLKRLFGKG